MAKFTRKEILKRLMKQIDGGRPIIGAGSSAGIIAKCAELGGADLIIVYSTGKSRILGLPTTRIDQIHSNPVTLSMYDELANVVKDTPIIAGVEANDPTCYDLEALLKRFLEKGFNGVINFPTVGMESGRRRDQIESLKESLGISWGFAREVEMTRILHDWDVFTMCYVFTPEDAASMVMAGVDVVCAHVGGTTGGLTGFKAVSMDGALDTAQRIISGARKVNPNIICLAHGGPFAEPKDTKYLYEKTDAQGFVGASSIERIPVEKAVIGCVKEFKSLYIRKK